MPQTKKTATADLLFLAAQHMGLQPRWLTKKGLFVIHTAQGERYVNHARSSLNPQVNAGLARNKFHSRLILDRHNLPNIPYARPTTMTEAVHFLVRHEVVVAKPVSGQGSRDIHIIRTPQQLYGLNVKKYIFEKYITGKEMRYLVLDGKVIAVHQSEYGTSVAEDRDLDRISFYEAEWNEELRKLSLTIADVFGLKFIAVDFLLDTKDTIYILEINTVPGLKWFHAPTTGPPVDVASLFLKSLVQDPQATKLSAA